MRIIAIIIPLMWGTLIFGHGEEKHEPKIIDDHKEAHDLFPYITTGLASEASMCLLLRYFRWNSPDRRWWSGSALILLFFSSLSVAATGHLGATLSHVHQVEISKFNH